MHGFGWTRGSPSMCDHVSACQRAPEWQHVVSRGQHGTIALASPMDYGLVHPTWLVYTVLYVVVCGKFTVATELTCLLIVSKKIKK